VRDELLPLPGDRPQPTRNRENTYRTYHSAVFVLQQMAVIDKRPYGIWIAKIHPQGHAWIGRALSLPVRHIDGVPQERLIDWCAVPLRKHEMDLVDVKRMCFGGSVFIEDNWQLGQIGDQSFDAIAVSIQNLFDFNSYDGRISERTLILDPDTGEQVGQRP
jgi:hypothetical protein